MQGLITLDFGNSNPHAGLFQLHQGQWSLIKVAPIAELPIYLEQTGMSAHNSSVVVCEVKSREEEIQKLQENGFLVTRVKDYWRGGRFAGMPVHYAKTLGEDRLIEAFYCFKRDKSPTLIIDAGTFVTMDVVNEQGFIGGYIIPGMKAYFESYQRGELLKDVSVSFQFSKEIPSQTDEAIRESYTAFAALANKIAVEHKIKKIVITGGSSASWMSFFERDTQAHIVEEHPHLIHWALHYWMTTQIEPL